MKNISSGLASHIASEHTTLATCWKLTRKDAMVLGFTDHDKDIVFDGVTYKAATGFNPSSITSNANLAVDNQDVEGMLADSGITEADIFAGKYDSAQIEVFLLNYTDISQGKLNLKKGWLGEVVLHNHQFYAELRGLTQKLTQTIGELYSPSCRANLGDARCKVNLSSHQFSGIVSSVSSRQRFFVSGVTNTGGDFVGGTALFTSGANSGIGMEIKEHQYNVSTGAEIMLVLPMPYDITATNTVIITRGCDKTLATCKNKFANVLNFRGEPHVPGLDKLFETAGTRSDW
jgi:uncharacterized phage protein (TIGR02218 family)